MNTHSRRLLPREEDVSFGAGCWIALSIVACLPLGFVIWAFPPILLLIATWIVLLGMSIFSTETDERSTGLLALAKARPGESICTFARSFDCRAVDTRLIRATVEELQPWIPPGFPLRHTDRLGGDLRIDNED